MGILLEGGKGGGDEKGTQRKRERFCKDVLDIDFCKVRSEGAEFDITASIS